MRGPGAQPWWGPSPPQFFFQISLCPDWMHNKSVEFFFLQKCLNLHKRCGMFWNEWKISFQIFTAFRFSDIVIFELKIGNFRCKKCSKISRKKCCQHFFFLTFFFTGSLAPPRPPPGLYPWTPCIFGLMTLASQVLAQRHSRIACYSVFLLISHAP